MAKAMVLNREEELIPSSIFDSPKGENLKSRGQLLERKIDMLESLAGSVSNRRSRRWLNDRLLIELVPRLNVEEIRGLFAPPPWGENTPLSAFCLTNIREWDAFRNIDMDAELSMIQALESSSTKRKDHVDNEKMAALNAWRRVDCRTREAIRRNFLSDLLESYEVAFLFSNATLQSEGTVNWWLPSISYKIALHRIRESSSSADFILSLSSTRLA